MGLDLRMTDNTKTIKVEILRLLVYIKLMEKKY